MAYSSDHMLGSQRNGLNHVGMNMTYFDRDAGPYKGRDYPEYSDALLDWYRTKGVKCVRLMFTWEAVQSELGGPVPSPAPGYSDYWKDLTTVLTRLLDRGIYVILCPWQYNATSDGTDIVYANSAFSATDFADFWYKLAIAINVTTGNDDRVAFDLINEPHAATNPGEIGITLADWFRYAQDVIGAIRSAGATNTIFVPGTDYTAADKFTSNGSSTEWERLTDEQQNIAVSVHCYNSLRSFAPSVLSDACSALVAWARESGIKVNIGEIAIDAGENGRPRYCSTWPIAEAQWADWHNFCLENNDVIVGWNWWANSAADWWNEGDSCDADSPEHWGLTLDDGTNQTIYMDMIEATF